MTPPQPYAEPVPKADQLSRYETARILGVSVQTVDRYVHAGTLTPQKNPITRRVWFNRRQVEKLRDTRGAGR